MFVLYEAYRAGLVKPKNWITNLIAGLVVGVFACCRVQIAGPKGAFVVILAGITAHYGIEGLQVATLLTGFILLFMGLIKLGSVIKYISDPVIVGFSSGINVIIFLVNGIIFSD